MAEAHATSPSAGGDRVHVLLPLPLAGAYDYARAESGAEPGDFVVVPLGRRHVAGVVWGRGGANPESPVAAAKLKRIAEILEVPAMGETMRRFIDWVAAYTCADPGAVLRMAMSVPAALTAPRPRVGYRLAGPPPERLTPARRRVLEVLAVGPALTRAEIVEAAGVGASVVTGLVGSATLAEVALPATAAAVDPDGRRPGPSLTPEQQDIAEALEDAARKGGYSVSLLDGVTGAGKTEVYFEAIAGALAKHGQVLVLLPEIALTAQWLARFEARFGVPPQTWHSDLRQAERRRAWRAIAEGDAKVVVGARSALFLPFADLALIVVDEEHDGAFKQDEGVCYHARDMAVARASLAEIPIVLVSATPSLESLVNAERGRYRHLRLPNRPGAAELPEIEAIDMRSAGLPAGEWISPLLRARIGSALAAGEQALLFLNRRGYAPLTLCRRCGHRLECPNCATWLVEHRFQDRLRCHHCDFSRVPPEACPACEAEADFTACGPGVERILEDTAKLFPAARAEVVASDTVHGPRAAQAMIERIAQGEIDLVIGTQIIAKGHNFPLLTCVGVIDADLGLAGGDLRAAERTYQLMSQIAGRAGRGKRPGRAYLQTYMPEHPVMEALVSGDRDRFLEREGEARLRQGMPPYGRLVALVVSGPDEPRARDTAAALARAAPGDADIQVLGPAPAPLALLRGRFRYRLLLKASRGVRVSELTRAWVARVTPPANVRVRIDIDPYSFL